MTKKDKSIMKLGKVFSPSFREGNERVVRVGLIGEESRGPREVRIHAMANDCSAIKAALTQQAKEQSLLHSPIFGK